MSVLIRKLAFSDLEQIDVIEKSSFSVPWSIESFKSELLNDLAYYECAQFDGLVVGYMGMWKIFNEAHITNVAVLPEYRNKGIGKMLLEKMIEVCRCSEIDVMSLEVRKNNEPAKSLYRKFGFREVGMRPNYYTKPTEDAIIMVKDVN